MAEHLLVLGQRQAQRSSETYNVSFKVSQALDNLNELYHQMMPLKWQHDL